MSRRRIQIAVLLPLIGLLTLIGRAELAARSGPTFQIRIGGYDPRDLLHGRYLQYGYVFNWQGPHSCGDSAEGATRLHADCCLCLTHDGKEGYDPPVAQISCQGIEPGACDGVLRASAVEPPLRYFVPEANASELDSMVGSGAFALELTCGLDRRPAIRELLVDGVPWREALERAASVDE